MLLSPSKEHVRRATTYATSPVAERDMAKCIASPARTERENPCLLFVTASVVWLNLGPGGDTARRPTTEGNAFLKPTDGGHLLSACQSGQLQRCYYKGAGQIEDVTDLV